MILKTNQDFSAHFCRVRLYKAEGEYETTKRGSAYQDNWTQEIIRYIDSVEVVTRTVDKGTGEFNIVLNAPLDVFKMWLDNKDYRGGWIRHGLIVGIVFGYRNGDETEEFRGSVALPGIDFNPISPTITLSGPIAGKFSWESFDSISPEGKSCLDIIIRKMNQLGYHKDSMEISKDFKDNLKSTFEETIPNGQGLNEFVSRTLPKMYKGLKSKTGEISLMNSPVIRTMGEKIYFSMQPIKVNRPDIVFRFMGKYNLNPQGNDPQVVVINNFRLPINWTEYDPSSYTSSMAGNIMDSGQIVEKQEEFGSAILNTGPALSRTEDVTKATQIAYNIAKDRYLVVKAEVDTIGIPVLGVGNTVQFHNIGLLIDNGTWNIFSAAHKWNKQGYTSNWGLTCLDIENTFGAHSKRTDEKAVEVAET
jgi:hypothetical protein